MAACVRCIPGEAIRNRQDPAGGDLDVASVFAICPNDAIRATQHFRLTGYYETRGLGVFQPPRTAFGDG